MKARIIYLPQVEHTVKAAQEALLSCQQFGIDAELFKGYAPKEADELLNRLNIKPYSPGPKLYDIKNSKGGVRGCFASHLTMWKECANVLNEPLLIMEHDARIVREIPDVEFQDVLHLDAWRFEEDPEYDTEEPEVMEYFEMRKDVKTMKGAYAYIIKPHAARKLIELAIMEGFTAADMHISDRAGLKLERIMPRCGIVSDTRSLTSDKGFYI